MDLFSNFLKNGSVVAENGLFEVLTSSTSFPARVSIGFSIPMTSISTTSHFDLAGLVHHRASWRRSAFKHTVPSDYWTVFQKIGKYIHRQSTLEVDSRTPHRQYGNGNMFLEVLEVFFGLLSEIHSPIQWILTTRWYEWIKMPWSTVTVFTAVCSNFRQTSNRWSWNIKKLIQT